METYDLLENSILQIANGKVVKKSKNRVSSLLLLLSGAILMALNTNKFNLIENGTITTALFFTGVVLFIWGLIALFVKKEQYVHVDTGTKLKKYSLEFDSQEFDKITRLYDGSHFKEMVTLKKNSQASGLILKLMGTENGEIYFSQVLKYVPYTFVPTGHGQIHEGKIAGEIKVLITSYQKK
jgi:hypothetical protein